MIKNKQLVCDKEKGDCFRACLTSILELPNDSKLPNCDQTDWLSRWHTFLYDFGLTLNYEQKSCWRLGYWIANVKSKNFADTTHAIVMNGTDVAHDPSTKECYLEAESLLGQDVVLGGWSLEAIDPSKLYQLEEYKRSIN